MPNSGFAPKLLKLCNLHSNYVNLSFESRLRRRFSRKEPPEGGTQNVLHQFLLKNTGFRYKAVQSLPKFVLELATFVRDIKTVIRKLVLFVFAFVTATYTLIPTEFAFVTVV